MLKRLLRKLNGEERLVDFFKMEFAKDYDFAKRNMIPVDDKYVRDFLRLN